VMLGGMLHQLKISMKSGIEFLTFRVAAKYLNQLCYRMPPQDNTSTDLVAVLCCYTFLERWQSKQ
jgi:hypothetical protein